MKICYNSIIAKKEEEKMSKALIHTVDGINGECVIRHYLKSRLGFSTSLIAKVKYGGVRVNGEIVHMRHILKCGDIIKVEMPEEDSEDIEPIPIPLSIVYEDEYILAVNKPRNMPVHPCRGNSLPTLANAVMAYLGKPFVFRAVNRLDRDTSGIVIIAKDMLSSAKLCEAMKSGGFSKTYVGKVVGTPSPKSGVINAPIRRRSEGEMIRIVSPDGKPSITEYRVISESTDGSSVCELTPITGRTHQLRVHMAHIGHPLVNDFLYGDRTDPSDTYRLHCKKITFPHPNGKLITLECEPDFV